MVLITTTIGEILEFSGCRFNIPNCDVEIYAEFEPIVNPSTGLTNPYTVCVLLFAVGVGSYLLLKKKTYI